VELLEDRTVFAAHTLATAAPIPPNGMLTDTVAAPGQADFYQVTVTDNGLLLALAQAAAGNSLHARLSLLGPDGQLLIQSDGVSPPDPTDLISQHLSPGTYYLEVQGRDAGTGAYTLTTRLEPASAPFHSFPGDVNGPIVAGDFNGNGILDLATTDKIGQVSVYLGVGDGTFRAAKQYAVGSLPMALVVGDFDRDGTLDLATANLDSSDVSVLLGVGDGTFRPEMRFPAGSHPWDIVTGDFYGNGILDLATANASTNDVSILQGRGDGTFGAPVRVPVGDGPFNLVAGDFNGDGRADLAIANQNSNDVSILLSRPDGTFAPQERYPVGQGPGAIVTGDFTGDGHLGVAVANLNGQDVSVLLGRGDGTFRPEERLAVRAGPYSLTVGDFTGNGQLDLAVVNSIPNDISVLLGRGDGTFQDQKELNIGDGPASLVVGDFNGDGRIDLADTNGLGASVLLGRGDGTFQDQPRLLAAEATYPFGITAADFTGDGRLDLATANNNTNDVSILLALKNGGFASQVRYPADTNANSLVAGDFNGDGHLDLAVVNVDSNDVTILLGQGNGTFVVEGSFPAGPSPFNIVAGDFTGDGILDLAMVNRDSNTVSILLGRGDGTFVPDPYSPLPEGAYPVGGVPLDLVEGDFAGDGHLDLATANNGSNDVSVLLGRGDGTFEPERRYAAGTSPIWLATGEFTGNGRLDLAVANTGSADVSILLGAGDGTFLPQTRIPLGAGAWGLVTGDFTGHGHLDLAVSTGFSDDVRVLAGRGDGTFLPPVRYAVGSGPQALLAGDLNNDNRPDLVVANPSVEQVAVALSVGDGTFAQPGMVAGGAPSALAAGDFNRDGRPDLAVADINSNDISVLLGIGDGTFRDPVQYPTGTAPVAVKVGDFNGDGILDLVTANRGSDDVSVLLGRGEGKFAAPESFPLGTMPDALVVGDFTGNGILDIATADPNTDDVTVLLGHGDGTFGAPLYFAAGSEPVALVAGDFTGDGILDLAVADAGSNEVSVLLGRGDGTFQAPRSFAVGDDPVAIVAGDFTGDGVLDLATADARGNVVSVLLGRGDGTFAAATQFPVGDYPVALATGDFNGDGRLDLMTANQQSGVDATQAVSVLLGLGDGRFVAPAAVASDIRSTPVVADLNGDGVPDVAVLNRQGRILLRQGRPGAPGTFAPPVVVNAEPDPPARDLAVVRTGAGLVLAALDARDSSVSLYARRPDGTFARTAGPVIPGGLPVRLAAGDLNGDGRGDLVVATAGSDQVFVYLQHTDGSFGSAPDYQTSVGVNPSAITLADVDGDGRLDIVVTNQFSGDVSVLRNDSAAPFTVEQRFRAGAGLYGVEQVNGSLAVDSFEGAAGVVAGRFDEEFGTDLVVTNSGANTVSLLTGPGDGGFLNPDLSRTFGTGSDPTAVVAADFNGDGHLDLAVLDQQSGAISILLGDGYGHFTLKGSVSAGNAPTGLAVADINGNGIPDLLIGNQFGDVLVLLGNGDGTFQPYRRTDGQIALAVADLKGDGKQDFIFADQSLDRVAVQYPQPGQTFTQDRSDGLLAPGAVAVADLNGDGIPDLVVANSGGNDVLVYLGLGNGQFTPARSFPAGTDPVGITIADLAGAGIPDVVVANEGSNDVTVLLGQGRGDSWTLTEGPRLQAGEGPVSTTIADVTGSGIPDIVVTNSQSNNVYVLPGVGNGFFNDQHPLVFNTGLDPRQVLVGDFTGDGRLDLVSVNAGSNDLTFFRDFGVGIDIASGGETPVVALAGDFGGNGAEDLLVANNGDGRVTLLLGGPDGLTAAETFSRAGVPHPTALALTTAGEQTNVFVAEEGRESAFLLTSFGIVVPGPEGRPPAPPLTDVFVVNGPGFENGLDILLAPGASGEKAAAGPGGGAGQPGQTNVAFAPESAVMAGAGGAGLVEDDGALFPGGLSSDGGAAIAYLIGLQEAFGRLRGEAPPAAAGPELPPFAPAAAAVDRLLGDWLPAARAEWGRHGPGGVLPYLRGLRDLAAGPGTAAAFDLRLQVIASALLEAGAAATAALGQRLDSFLRDIGPVLPQDATPLRKLPDESVPAGDDPSARPPRDGGDDLSELPRREADDEQAAAPLGTLLGALSAAGLLHAGGWGAPAGPERRRGRAPAHSRGPLS
jgi:hypothetical protein